MPHKKKAAKKAAPVENENTDAKGTLWQWYDDGDKDWIDFAQADSKLFETRFAAATAAGDSLKFQLAKELSFNKKHGTKYTFDLTGPSQRTQKNEESGTVKKLRRLVDGAECYKLPAEPKKRDRDDSGAVEKTPAIPFNNGNDNTNNNNTVGSGGGFVVLPPLGSASPFWDEASNETKKGRLGGPGITEETVRATEKLLGGRKLPAAYVTLLRQTGVNGGKTNCRGYKRTFSGGKVYFEQLDVIFGFHGSDTTQELIKHTQFWIDHYDFPNYEDDTEEFPEEGCLVFFCKASKGDGHQGWCLDYRKCGPKGEPAVVFIDSNDLQAEPIADSFASFLNLVGEYRVNEEIGEDEEIIPQPIGKKKKEAKTKEAPPPPSVQDEEKEDEEEELVVVKKKKKAGPLDPNRNQPDEKTATPIGTCKSPFWDLKHYSTEKAEVTDDMIKKTEKLLGGRKLPAAYVNLLRSTGVNGGRTNNRHVIRKIKDGTPDPDHQYDTGDGGGGYTNFDVLFGVCGGNQEARAGLVRAQKRYLKIEEYPDIGIYFCDETDACANGAWCWDYRKCGPKGEPSVAYLDFEDQQPIKIADNFQELLDMLSDCEAGEKDKSSSKNEKAPKKA